MHYNDNDNNARIKEFCIEPARQFFQWIWNGTLVEKKTGWQCAIVTGFCLLRPPRFLKKETPSVWAVDDPGHSSTMPYSTRQDPLTLEDEHLFLPTSKGDRVGEGGDWGWGWKKRKDEVKQSDLREGWKWRDNFGGISVEWRAVELSESAQVWNCWCIGLLWTDRLWGTRPLFFFLHPVLDHYHQESAKEPTWRWATHGLIAPRGLCQGWDRVD